MISLSISYDLLCAFIKLLFLLLIWFCDTLAIRTNRAYKGEFPPPKHNLNIFFKMKHFDNSERTGYSNNSKNAYDNNI